MEICQEYLENRSKRITPYRPWRASDDVAHSRYIYDSGVKDGEARAIAYLAGENVRESE
jgi:hypothetical protein